MRTKQINYNLILITMLLLYRAVHNYICTAINIVLSMVMPARISQELFDGVIWALVIAICVPYFMQKLNARHVLVLLVFWAAALVMFAFGLSSEFNADRLITLCLTVLPMFLVGSVIEVKKEDFKYLYWMSLVVVVVSIAYQAYRISGGDDTLARDNMDFSYKLLPAVLVVVSGMFYNKKKVWSIFAGSAAIVAIVLQGTRGPVLCIGIFLIIMLIKRFGILKVIPAMLVLLGLFIAFSQSSIYESTMESIIEVIDKTGLSSEFVERILEEEITDDAGRKELYDAILKEIEKAPFEFRGLYADRALLNQLAGSENRYVHNIFYELMYDFGVFLGGIIFLTVMISTLIALIRVKQEELYLVNILAACGFVMLFVSGSFADSGLFLALLGCVCQAVLAGRTKDNL